MKKSILLLITVLSLNFSASAIAATAFGFTCNKFTKIAYTHVQDGLVFAMTSDGSNCLIDSIDNPSAVAAAAAILSQGQASAIPVSIGVSGGTSVTAAMSSLIINQ